MSSPTVTFILGYCGSGKTYLADSMAKKGIRKFDEGFLREKKQHRDLIKNLRYKNDCVVVEIAYCMKKYRVKILKELTEKVPGVTIKWIYFEDNRTQADRNCRRRLHHKGHPEEHAKINKRLSKYYEVPPWVTPKLIYKLPMPK